MALLLRLIAFPLLPGLSDDGYRYLWDGLLQVEGANPYAHRPEDLGGRLDAALYAKLNSAGYYSVYPPASQLVFLLGGVAAKAWGWMAGWYVIKAAFVSLEIIGIWALSRLVPGRLLILYAWHPLVVLEISGQAHTEAGMVGGLLFSLWAYRHARPGLSVAFLTIAGWFKIYPLVLLPFLLRRVGWSYGWVAVGVSCALLAPYASWSAPGHIAESLDLYVRSFEFNAGPYYALKELGYLVSGDDWSKILGPLLRAVFLVALAGLFLADWRYRWPIASVWIAVLGLLWSTATTVHPWYLVGVLALVPLKLAESPSDAGRLNAVAWLWLSAAALGTYLFYTHGDLPYWIAVIVGWSGWAALLGLAAGASMLPSILQLRARSKWRWMARYAVEPRNVLDLGAGEGYVGASVASETGAEVTLADVVDFNRTSMPLVVFDGQRLPFEDKDFDLAIVVFVLHHADQPERLLQELRRVVDGRVLVIESVYESALEQRWLEAADKLANRIRSGGRMRPQEEHLAFRNVVAWRDTFGATGFEIEHEEQRGNGFHRQHLFVLR